MSKQADQSHIVYLYSHVPTLLIVCMYVCVCVYILEMIYGIHERVLWGPAQMQVRKG
jgi:hypothetical protein